MSEAGTVRIGFSVDQALFLKQIAEMGQAAAKTLEQSISKASKMPAMDMSAVTKSVDKLGDRLHAAIADQTQAIDYLSDFLHDNLAKGIADAGKTGGAQMARAVENVKLPKVKVELDRAQLEAQLKLYGDRWTAIDNQRIAQAKKVAQIKAQLEKSGGDNKLAEQLAKEEKKLVDLKLAAAQADAQIVQLERSLSMPSAPQIPALQSIGTASKDAGILKQQIAYIDQQMAQVKARLANAYNELAAARQAYIANSPTQDLKGFNAAPFEAAIDKANAQLMKLTAQSAQFKGKLANMNQEMAQTAVEVDKVEKSTGRAGAGFKKLVRVGLGMIGVRSLLTGIRRLTLSVIGDFKRMAGTNAAFAASLNGLAAAGSQLKGSFAAMAAPLVNALAPALQTIVSWATAAFNAIARLIGALTGMKTVQIATGSTKKFTQGLGAAAGAAGKARKENEKLKRELAGFDEIEIVDPNKGADTGGGGGGGGGGAGMDPGVVFTEVDTGLEGWQKKLTAFLDTIRGTKAFSILADSADKGWKQIKTSATKAWTTITKQWEDSAPRLVQVFTDIGPRLAEAMANIGGYVFMPLVAGALGAGIEIGGTLIAGILDVFTNAAELVGVVLAPILDSINEFWAAHGEEISTLIYDTWETISTGVSGIIEGIREVFVTVFGGIKEWWEEHGEVIKEQLVTTWETIWSIIQPIWVTMKSTAELIFGAIKDFLIEIAPKIKNAIVSGIDLAWKIIKPLWDLMLNVAKTVFGELKAFWERWGGTIKSFFANTWEVIKNNFKFVLDLISGVFRTFSAIFSGDWEGAWIAIKATAVNLWNNMKDTFKRILDGMSNIFELFGVDIDGVWGDIKKVFEGIINFITGVFTGDWEKAWQGVQDVFAGIFNALKGIFVAPMNAIIDAINWVIRQLNKIKIPDWVPDWLGGGKGINISEISPIQLATGGLIDQPTLALVGESGQEAVMPLERNTGWIDKLAAMIADKGGAGDEAGGDINLTIPVSIGEDGLLDIIERTVERGERMRNAPVFS